MILILLAHTFIADVSLSPDPSQLPGGSALQALTNGLGGWALIITLAGLLIGAATWAIGSHSQNYQQAMSGRRAVVVAGANWLRRCWRRYSWRQRSHDKL